MPPLLLATFVLVLALAALVIVVLLRRRRRPGAPALPSVRAPESPALLVPRPGPALVLVHGILGFDHIQLFGQRVAYFRGIAEALRAQGVTVHTPQLPPLASVPARAEALTRFVSTLPSERVHLVAHSMGGLDARFALARLGLGERVASLVTVATPHRGTPLADLGAAVPLRALRSLVGRVGLATEAVDWLTTHRLDLFNRDIHDVPGVLYGCVVGRSAQRTLRVNPVLLSGHLYLSVRVGANDGMVPADSQYWGEIFDEIEADHWAQVGWSSYFDAGAVYLRLYESLRQRGL
ncbi:alpha/beta fold hydrolase [Haliangium sp.]|uniref:alpha/beta fold hydrolase n=1 Tax=Haliangium sp. TaxID=2663208 RepID=UPI003D09F00A